MSWPDGYAEVAGRLTEQAGKARLIFTGASACVDAIFRIDAERLGRLAHAARLTDDKTGAGLLARVMARITGGRGGELLTRWPHGPSWVTELLGPPDGHQVGGTGPQASWALATVGAQSILALRDRSAEQLAVIDPRAGICAGGKVVPAGSITPSGTPTKLPHCILEFSAGTTRAGVTVPRSSRIILRFGDEPIECDEQFLPVTTALAPAAGGGLLSGLNSLAENSESEGTWLSVLGQAWSEARLPVIHHELAEFPTARRLREAAALGAATSLGMSRSELFMLTGGSGDPRVRARDAAVMCRVGRVIVHADDWALAVHRDDPGHQEQVLMAGCALAASRARTGQPTSFMNPSPEATYTDQLPADGELGDGWRATCVPAPHLRRPAGTVGLGDTFVAGVLLAESLRDHD